MYVLSKVATYANLELEAGACVLRSHHPRGAKIFK